MEQRWDGPAQVKKLGDDPSKSQINALFAIPGDTKTDSSLPHHAVSADGTVGAADKDGCTAAIAALNGGRGGVSATTAQKNRAYSHLASHLRAMGETPPTKQFAAGAPLELRAQRRLSMLRVPERIALQFGASGVEMRAKANGTGGTKFQFNGYATVYGHPFQMWDFWGDEFDEEVAQLAGQRTLANGCDVPFLVGHNDAGIPMARTKSGTMQLGEDSHGLWVDAPDLDGQVEQIRQLASAVERGDMDEMSMAFMTIRQDWSPDYMKRTILEYDLHKGDVSVVVFGANDGTAGSTMVALPADQLCLRRPVGALRNRRRGEQRAPTRPYTAHDGETNECPQCHSVNDDTASYCDQCGTQMQPAGMFSNMTGVEDMIQACPCGKWNSGDAKFCGSCGRDLTGSGGSGSGSYLFWRDGRPRERRSADEIIDNGGPPDSNIASNGLTQVKCPYTTANSCGKMNAGGAQFCDGCGGPLYEGDGTLVVDDSGVVEAHGSGGDADLLHRRRELELLKLA